MWGESVYPLAWFYNAEGFSSAICKHPLKIITLRSSFNLHKMQRISWFCSSLMFAEKMSFYWKWLDLIFECVSLGAQSSCSPALLVFKSFHQLAAGVTLPSHLYKCICGTHFCGTSAQDPCRQPVKYVAAEQQQTAELTMQLSAGSIQGASLLLFLKTRVVTRPLTNLDWAWTWLQPSCSVYSWDRWKYAFYLGDTHGKNVDSPLIITKNVIFFSWISSH